MSLFADPSAPLRTWIFALVTSSALAAPSLVAMPAAAEEGCAAWDVEYVLAANLRLTDTPMGQGDGVYSIGPGRVVLRFEDRGGQPGGAVKMLLYSMQERFTIRASTLFWTTTVTTDTRTGAEERAVAAEGTMKGRVLEWLGSVRGYHTDGTLTCDGSMCGKFGAPPPGKSELHIGPSPVRFSSFTFAPDGKTFTMASTFVAKTEMPKQTAFVSLAGREARRVCVPAR